MTELRTQMKSLLVAAVRDPGNRAVYLWCWRCCYKARELNEYYNKLLRGEG